MGHISWADDRAEVRRTCAVGAIIRAFAAERSELLRNFESQRLATLEWATAERREAIAEVRRELAGSMEALRGERAVVVDDLRHIVDVVLLRVAIFLVAAVMFAPARRSRLRPCLAPAMARAAEMIARTERGDHGGPPRL